MNNRISAAVAALGGLPVESAGLGPDGMTFVLGGPTFSFWVLASWRLVREGEIVASTDVDWNPESLLRGRMVERIVAQSNSTGVDPAFDFGGGLWLEIFSEAWIDPWMLSVGKIREVIGDPGEEELFERVAPDSPTMLDDPWEIAEVRREGWGGTNLIVIGGGQEFVVRSSWRVLSETRAVEVSGVRPGRWPPADIVGRKVIATRPQGSVLSADRTLLIEGGFAIETFSTAGSNRS